MLTATTWTASGTPHSIRALIQPELPELPPGAQLSAASLTLFATTYRDTFRLGGGHHQIQVDGQPTASNMCHLLIVTEPWEEMNVTWNNQPSTTLVGSFSLPESTTYDQDYVVDITSWAAPIYAGTSANHGLMLQLDQEQHYASLYFDSTDVDPLQGTAPRIEVTYECPEGG